MPFRTVTPVRWDDIDPAGVVYYPRFLHYCHTAMEDFFARALEVPYPKLTHELRLGFPAVHVDVDFRSPLRYGDEVEVTLRIGRLGKTSVDWRYELRRQGDGTLSAEARVVTACLDLDAFRARSLPDWLRAKLEAPEYGAETGQHRAT
jgi:4-hydroxybenzoyl-CoA thioesterase